MVEREQYEARVGKTVKKWRLDALLGFGGMAAVYAATHKNGHRVAIKILHPQMALNQEIRERFAREPYVANKVGHPGAVSVLDDDVTDAGEPFFVMEILDGCAVADLADARGGQLEVDEVLWLTDGLLDVLAAAHAADITHRDIKPDNVFVTTDGTIKILDFGIARFAEYSLEHATRTGFMMGTPAYMAPEQARGRWSEVGPRTDLWAVGAFMYALLSGRPVHEADTMNELLLKAMTARAASIREALPDLPEAVAAVVDKALAHDPDARFSDAPSMQAALRTALAELAGGALEGCPPGLLDCLGDTMAPMPAPGAPSEVDRSQGGATAARSAAESDEAAAGPSSDTGAELLATSERAPTLEGTSQPTPGDKRSRAWVLFAALVVLGGGGIALRAALFRPAPLPSVQPTATASADPERAERRRWWLDLPKEPKQREKAVARLPPPKRSWLDLHRQAHKLLDRGDYAEAEKVLRKALALAKKVLGPADAAYHETLERLAEALAKQGKLAEAEEVLRQAVDVQRRYGKPGDAEFDGARQALVYVLVKQGKVDAARGYWREGDPPMPAIVAQAAGSSLPAPGASASAPATTPATALPSSQPTPPAKSSAAGTSPVAASAMATAKGDPSAPHKMKGPNPFESWGDKK